MGKLSDVSMLSPAVKAAPVETWGEVHGLQGNARYWIWAFAANLHRRTAEISANPLAMPFYSALQRSEGVLPLTPQLSSYIGKAMALYNCIGQEVGVFFANSVKTICAEDGILCLSVEQKTKETESISRSKRRDNRRLIPQSCSLSG